MRAALAGGPGCGAPLRSESRERQMLVHSLLLSLLGPEPQPVGWGTYTGECLPSSVKSEMSLQAAQHSVS